MSTQGTREKILDVAESLFAERGFAETSLRLITAKAGVNSAAVNYHFRSKEGLIQEVFARRFAAINGERLRRLEDVLSHSKEGRPDVRDILHALVGPVLEVKRGEEGGEERCRRLIGRAHSDPGKEVQTLFLGQFRGVMARFLEALERALPQLSREEVCWRLRFVVGGMAHAMASGRRFRDLWATGCSEMEESELEERLVSFLEAGMIGVSLPSGKEKAR
jgi:AcrR family transcriptional regulator